MNKETIQKAQNMIGEKVWSYDPSPKLTKRRVVPVGPFILKSVTSKKGICEFEDTLHVAKANLIEPYENTSDYRQSLWRQEIDSSGYELQVCSEIHWKVFAYDTRFDVWPKIGKWLEQGKKSVIGFESFRERLDELGEEAVAAMSREEK